MATHLNTGSVAIIGAGQIGCATAAHLQQRGIRAAMWSPTAARLHVTDGVASLRCTGAIDDRVNVDLLGSPAELSAFDVILICVPGNAYADVLGPLARVWRSGQTLVTSGSLSLCPLWLRETAAGHGQQVQVAGWGTTPTTAHFLADGRLHVNPLRDRIDMAALDLDDMPSSALLCARLLGDRFVSADNLLAPTLANINPIAHAAEVIPNLTRMDKGEDWPLFGCFTPAVARLAEGLDKERLAIAAAFGFALPTLGEHYGRSYHIALGGLEHMAAEIEARGMGPKGPGRLAHRYVLEDAPFGLAFQESLGRMAGVATPVLSASITLLQTIYGRDFRAENFLVDALALREADASSLRKRCAAARSAATLPRCAPLSR